MAFPCAKVISLLLLACVAVEGAKHPLTVSPSLGPGKSYHLIVGDVKTCLNEFQIQNKWRDLGPGDLSLVKRKTSMTEISLPPKTDGSPGAICGYLSAQNLPSMQEDPHNVRANAIVGKLLFNSTDVACRRSQSPPRSRLTIISRTLIDSISSESSLPGVNLQALKDLFGGAGESTRLFFYRNGGLSGDLKNCVYLDTSSPPAKVMFENAADTLFNRSALHNMSPPRAPSFELILEDLFLESRMGKPGRSSGLDQSETDVMAMSGAGEAQTTKSDGSKNSSDRSNSNSCFPSAATVETRDGSKVRMSDIAVGDSVRVGPNQFSEVFMFTHKLSQVETTFTHLVTSSGAELSLSHGHYIYSDGALVPAFRVRIGSVVVLGTGETDVVTSIQIKRASGLYNPQTLHGDIVVNGILASTYTTAVKPSLAHVLLGPFRLFHDLFGLGTRFLESGLSFLGTSWVASDASA